MVIHIIFVLARISTYYLGEPSGFQVGAVFEVLVCLLPLGALFVGVVGVGIG
jgi:hypothetical protein